MKMEEIRNLIEEDKKIVSNLNELNDIQNACKIDLERRQLYTTYKYSNNQQIYIK